MNDLPLIPSIYLVRLIELIKKEELPANHILRESGIDSSTSIDSYVSINQIKAVVYYFLKLTHKANAGVEYGLNLDATDHGFLGYVYSFNGDSAELIKRIINYMNVRLPFFNVTMRIEGDYFLARISSSIVDEEIDGFFRAAYITSLYFIASMLVPNIHLKVRHQTFQKTADIVHVFRNNISFNNDFDEMYCSIEVNSSLNKAITSEPTEASVADMPALVLKLRQLLIANHYELTSAEQAASQLGMSERTLRRKLSEVGYSFRSIRQEMLMKTALRYLQHSNISIERIAEKCGYSDQASFTRAFQNWQGATPDSIRKNKVY